MFLICLHTEALLYFRVTQAKNESKQQQSIGFVEYFLLCALSYIMISVYFLLVLDYIAFR